MDKIAQDIMDIQGVQILDMIFVIQNIMVEDQLLMIFVNVALELVLVIVHKIQQKNVQVKYVLVNLHVKLNMVKMNVVSVLVQTMLMLQTLGILVEIVKELLHLIYIVLIWDVVEIVHPNII